MDAKKEIEIKYRIVELVTMVEDIDVLESILKKLISTLEKERS